MGLSQMLTDVKDHLAHGEQLLASHIPALVEWAAKAEADPLVAFAVSSLLPASARALIVDLGTKLEADYAQVTADAQAKAQADAAAAAAPAPEPPADPAADPAAVQQPQVMTADS